jgi:hypothetical protein
MVIQFLETNFLWVVLTVIGVLSFLVVVFLIGFKQDQNDHFQAIQQRMNYGLVFRFNLALGQVEEYDLRKGRALKKFVLDQFLKSFYPKQQQAFIAWLNALISKQQDAPWTFQSPFIKDKRQQQVIFEVNYVDHDQQIINLNRYVLRYLKPNPKQSRLSRRVLTTEEALRLTKKLGAKDGAFFYISFNFGRSSLDDQFKTFYLSQFKEKLLPYLSNQLQIIDTLNDIYILSTQRLERQGYISIAQTFIRMIAQYLELNSLDTLVKFTVSIVEHQYFPNDLKALILKAREMNAFMFSKSMNFLVYDPIQPMSSTQDQVVEYRRKELFAKFNFHLGFRPYIDLSTFAYAGQLIQIQPSQDMILTTLEILQMASNTNDARGFYDHYVKKIQDIHISTSEKLIVPLSIQMPLDSMMKEYDVFSTPFRHQFFFDELEIKELNLPSAEILPLLSLFTRQKINVGLVLDDANHDLDSSIYEQCQFFVLDARRIQFLESDEKALLQFKRILQVFAVYNKPFMVFDLHSEGAVDLLPLNRVKILSADFLLGWQKEPMQPTVQTMNRFQQRMFKQEKIYGKTN